MYYQKGGFGSDSVENRCTTVHTLNLERHGLKIISILVACPFCLLQMKPRPTGGAELFLSL